VVFVSYLKDRTNLAALQAVEEGYYGKFFV
jgi:hypothetical protein